MPGYEGRYEVSDAGQVRSLLRGGRLLQPGTNGAKGYLMVILAPRKKRYIHHLVAEAFIGPRAPGQVIRHLDDDRLNNIPANLAYGTTAQNNRDMTLHGRHWKGRRTCCAKGHPFDYWDGKQRVCRKCRAARVAEWVKRHPEYAAVVSRRKRERRKATSQGDSPR